MSELRRDAITGRYVIVAPERRLSREAFLRPSPAGALGGDRCPFCEGQEGIAGREILAWRPSGSPHDGPGWQLRVVANREPALRIESHLGEASESLFSWFGGLGAHEVVIESPDHRATLATMTVDEVERVLWAWRERIRDLRRDFRFESFLVVKNHGQAAGATLDHPHSQVLALPLVPQHLEDELKGARDYYEQRGSCVFCDLAEQEVANHARVVGSDERSIAFAPFAARVPFETWIVAREHCGPLEDVSDASLRAVAERLRDVMQRLDRVLLSPAYTLLLHTAPVEAATGVVIAPTGTTEPSSTSGSAPTSDGARTADVAPTSDVARTADLARTSNSGPRTSHSYFHWHLEIVPRLLPVPGLAWDGGIHINPVPPEEAAQALREAKIRRFDAAIASEDVLFLMLFRFTLTARKAWAMALGVLLLAVTGPGVAQDAAVSAPIRGFTSKGSAAERAVERRFREPLSAESIRSWHRYFTSEPHPATSPRTREIADYIAAQWKAQGLEDVVIHRYDVLSSNPRRVRAELVAPIRYVPSLREDPIKEDPDSFQRGISGAWVSFSASGDVTAPVVYANSGNPADYDVLRKNGIDPKGKIVVVRYSNPYSYRGFKALTAEREGAAAMIVYSDPQEDGYVKGDVVPKGPWGPASHIQRGGIAYDYIVPGDPLTPGWASTAGARRIPIGDAVSVPKVMALAMSHRDIQPILERLGGPPAPPEWKGGLPIEYRLGGDVARLRLQIDMRTDVQPNYVVEGRIRGSERPDEWVVLGNHHDAWVFGGVDPSSGTASMMELTKSLGTLKQEGTRPGRTLVFCSWDGEEVTLTGSTEWGEQFRSELRDKAVAYLNVDSSASGPRLDLSAVGSLAPMIVDLARELDDPAGGSLYDAWRRPDREAVGPKDGLLSDQALAVTRIGSGSDHTVFINHVGLPVVEMGFTGPYGVYHSAYDSHYWVNTIGDPGFRYHRLMAELWGSMALRLANADILPLDIESYAGAVRDFVRRLDEIPGAADRLEIPRLVSAVRALRTSGRRLNSRVEHALAAGPLSPDVTARVNRGLLRFEQGWLHEEGIPGRPWFKHLLYAPRYTYAAMTLPGITEAAEQGDWTRAAGQLSLVVEAIARNTALADGLAAELPTDVTPGSLESRLRSVRDRVDGRMAVYVENVASGERVAIDADSSYETFSVIKVPLMAAVLERVRQGRLSLSDRVTLSADQRRIPSGVLYALDPGLAPTVRDLLTLMIIISDNEATDALGDLVGRDEVTAFMRRLGLPNTLLRFSDLDWDRRWLSQLDASYRDASGDRTVQFPFSRFGVAAVGEAFRRVIEETGLFFGRSTARETGRLFSLMAKGELVSAEASALMVSILKRQQVNNRFPRYLGADIEIAHKTGDGQPWVANDAGILWVKGAPIVLVVFAGHHRGSTEAIHEAEARMAAEVADYFGGAVAPPLPRVAAR